MKLNTWLLSGPTFQSIPSLSIANSCQPPPSLCMPVSMLANWISTLCPAVTVSRLGSKPSMLARTCIAPATGAPGSCNRPMTRLTATIATTTANEPNTPTRSQSGSLLVADVERRALAARSERNCEVDRRVMWGLDFSGTRTQEATPLPGIAARLFAQPQEHLADDEIHPKS